MSEILITGATGNVGGDLAKIFERKPALPVGSRALSVPVEGELKTALESEIKTNE